MSSEDQFVTNSIERFVIDVRGAWGDGKDPQLPYKVKAAMERMLKSTTPDEIWMAHLIRESKPAKGLYRDPDHGFVQMGHVHKAGHKNPPHDHGPCWVVYGVYTGAIEITTFARVDNGKEPGRATLETKEIHRLTPGVVYPYLVGEIHSTRAIEVPAVVFRFLSYDLNKVERQRFDLEKGTVVMERAAA